LADVFETLDKAATAIGEMMLSGSAQGDALTIEAADQAE
jgi:hypothetical protein